MIFDKRIWDIIHSILHHSCDIDNTLKIEFFQERLQEIEPFKSFYIELKSEISKSTENKVVFKEFITDLCVFEYWNSFTNLEMATRVFENFEILKIEIPSIFIDKYNQVAKLEVRVSLFFENKEFEWTEKRIKNYKQELESEFQLYTLKPDLQQKIVFFEKKFEQLKKTINDTEEDSYKTTTYRNFKNLYNKDKFVFTKEYLHKFISEAEFKNRNQDFDSLKVFQHIQLYVGLRSELKALKYIIEMQKPLATEVIINAHGIDRKTEQSIEIKPIFKPEEAIGNNLQDNKEAKKLYIKKSITERFQNANEMFVYENEYNEFIEILLNFFSNEKYLLPENSISMKRNVKTKIAHLLNVIHTDCSTNKLISDIDYLKIIQKLSCFEKNQNSEIYKSITK